MIIFGQKTNCCLFSSSWGPKDDGLRKEAPGLLTQRAMLQAIEKGRNGKG
jgi:kexin